MHQASVGFHCPDCARTGAQRVQRGVPRSLPRPLLTQVLVAVNAVVFLADVVITGPGSFGGTTLSDFALDAGLWPPATPEEPWRLVTSGFLHAGILHIALNMWVLLMMGRILEPALGRLRFAAVYAASLLVGSLGVTIFDVVADSERIAVTVGASGAIFGLMGALVVVARDRRVDLMRTGILPTIGINLVFTLTIPGISIGGHLGGLVGGLLTGLLAVAVPRRVAGPAGEAVAAAAIAVVGLIAAGTAVALSAATWTLA